MDVMHEDEAGDIGSEVLLHGFNVEAARRGFQKDVARLSNEEPGAAQNEQRDENGEQRIDWLPAGPKDDERSDDGAGRPKQIADDVQHRALDVEVVALGAMENEIGDNVHE